MAETAYSAEETSKYDSPIRSTFDEEIAQHSPDESPSEFLDTIKSCIFLLNHRVSGGEIIKSIDQDIHDIWHMFIEISKISHPEDAAQERLVLLLLYAEALGTLRSKIPGDEQTIITSHGMRVWTDLPNFATDMLGAWQKSGELSSTQRTNFAAFTGRLIAIDVCGADLSACALWLFRETLETHQTFSEITNDNDDGFVASELISACIMLLQHCGDKLLILCINNETVPRVDPNLVSPGEHAQQAGVCRAGLSMERWLYWRRTFQLMSKSEDEHVREQGMKGFSNMVCCGRHTGFKVVGEDNWWEKVKTALSKELQRSGKESVAIEEIVTDPDWVD
jgi:hypothetical protein